VSLPDTEHVPPPHGASQPHPLRASAAVIYGTLALLALTIPQGLVNWLKAFEPSAPQDILLTAALAVQSASNSLGLNEPFYRARRIFLDVTGKRED
jgi:hypothetical protein